MRIILKTLTYGATHVTVATTIAYLLTGNLTAAIGIGLIEPLVQTFVFSFHEYLWERPSKEEQPATLRAHNHSLVMATAG